jgi:excisionase family DNA binding protein
LIEKLYKVDDVAPQVQMTKHALYAAIRAGQFPHLKIGSRIRIPESALARWIEQQTAPNTKAQKQIESLAATV